MNPRCFTTSIYITHFMSLACVHFCTAIIPDGFCFDLVSQLLHVNPTDLSLGTDPHLGQGLFQDLHLQREPRSYPSSDEVISFELLREFSQSVCLHLTCCSPLRLVSHPKKDQDRVFLNCLLGNNAPPPNKSHILPRFSLSP